MRVFVVTVAGMSRRFSESVGYPCLKCLYHEKGIENSLLYRLLNHQSEFDYVIIVGGFMYDELVLFINENFKYLKKKIILVKNEYYADYGSGYSLYLALEKIVGMDVDEVIFAEGDLYVDEKGFRKVCDSENNVITCNREPILADKAVVFYFDGNDGIHYIYDTRHQILENGEPFSGIFNSGQIWKFANKDYLRQSFYDISEAEWRGTNLVFIQRYFGMLGKEEYKVIIFEKWINCNTVSDYKRINDEEEK